MTMNILEEALRATEGRDGRPSQYGAPLDHFTLTAALVNARFAAKLKEPLTAEDWAIVMVLDKLARHAHRGQRDSLIDVAGYARTLEMVAEERRRRQSGSADALTPVHALAPSKGNGQDVGVDARGRALQPADGEP